MGLDLERFYTVVTDQVGETKLSVVDDSIMLLDLIWA
jgi:hypothetical protein